MFTDLDVRSAAKVCVLGKTTADSLFPDEDPVGKIIRISMRGGSASAPMKVLGVLTAQGRVHGRHRTRTTSSSCPTPPA